MPGWAEAYRSLGDLQPVKHNIAARDKDDAPSILAIKDGLPKFKNCPADFGGSGETADE